MNLDEMNDSQWRSIDSCSDIAHDESITELISCSSELLDGPNYKEGFADDTLYESCISQDNREGSIIIEGELVDCMSNLQIVSVKKSRKFQNSIMPAEDPPNGPDKSDIKVESNGAATDVEGNDIPTKVESNDAPTEVKVNDTSTEMNGNDLPTEMKSCNVLTEPKTNPELQHMVKKAGKLLVPQPTRRTTKAVSPVLCSQSRARSHNMTLNNTTMNQSTAGPSNGVKPTADKKPTNKYVVKTIEATKEGIKLKEEKINFFGIPVRADRKKHTQAIPFSFQSRSKHAQSFRQPAEKSAPSKESTSSAPSRVPTSSATSRATLTSATLASKAKIVAKSSQNDIKTNQENKTPNVATIEGQKTKSKPTAIVPPKLHTDKRAKDRQEFDAKVKQRELEIEQMRARVEQRKREREKLEETALRKALESKAKPMPVFKVPAPIRSRKPLTEPQSPAWGLKTKNTH